jgi:hypothetical protein
MMVTRAQHVDCYEARVGKGRCTVANIIQNSRSGFSRLFARLRRPSPYRWYEVEGASF